MSSFWPWQPFYATVCGPAFNIFAPHFQEPFQSNQQNSEISLTTTPASWD